MPPSHRAASASPDRSPVVLLSDLLVWQVFRFYSRHDATKLSLAGTSQNNPSSSTLAIWSRFRVSRAAERVDNHFFNSAPWPLPGHPEAMKMVPSPTLTSALTGAIYLVGESPFNSVTQEPQVHRIVALRARTPDSPERGSSWRREGSTARDRKEKMWKGSSSDAPGSTCTRARSPRA